MAKVREGVHDGAQLAAHTLVDYPAAAITASQFNDRIYEPGSELSVLDELFHEDEPPHRLDGAEGYVLGKIAGEMVGVAVVARRASGSQPLDRNAIRLIKDFAKFLLDGLTDR